MLKSLLVALNHVLTIWLTTEKRCLLDPWKLDPFLCVVVVWNRQMCDDLCRWKMHRGLFLTDKALVFSHNMTSLQLGLTVTRRIFHSLRLNQAFPQLAAFWELTTFHGDGKSPSSAWTSWFLLYLWKLLISSEKVHAIASQFYKRLNWTSISNKFLPGIQEI